MSKIKRIIIDFENVSDDEQVKLWLSLWKFADKELDDRTNLNVWVVKK